MQSRYMRWAFGLAGGLVVMAAVAVIAGPARTVRAPSTHPMVSTAAAVPCDPSTCTRECPAPAGLVSTPKASPVRVAKAAPAKPNFAPGQAGMVIGIDPETGAIGMPSAQDVEALGLNRNQSVDESDAGLIEVAIPGRPGYTMDLQGRFQEYSVVRKAANGTVVLDCVQGQKKADALLKEPVAAPVQPAALEEK